MNFHMENLIYSLQRLRTKFGTKFISSVFCQNFKLEISIRSKTEGKNDRSKTVPHDI